MALTTEQLRRVQDAIGQTRSAIENMERPDALTCNLNLLTWHYDHLIRLQEMLATGQFFEEVLPLPR